MHFYPAYIAVMVVEYHIEKCPIGPTYILYYRLHVMNVIRPYIFSIIYSNYYNTHLNIIIIIDK